MGRSYYVESLTHEMQKRLEINEEVEELGRMTKTWNLENYE
jgi:methylmalonyl-CoA mutase N-terminal domain/subunit